MTSDFFEYKFRATGTSNAGGAHCTYCPKQIGEACGISCAKVYAELKVEREADGFIINDEPS